jgi:hypothetical protein
MAPGRRGRAARRRPLRRGGPQAGETVVVTTDGEQDAERWREAVRPVWRHIALGRRGQARDVTFKILEGMRAAGGTLARARTVRRAIMGYHLEASHD